LRVRRCPHGITYARPLNQAGMLVVRDRRGPVGEHHRDVILDPVAAP
jgi:hypothetical protein